jgi:hypothetical protein
MSGKPLLFLDVDGVLNSVQYYVKMHEQHAKLGQGIYSLDPGALAILQYIVSSTDCNIVMMSTWRRIHSIDRIKELFTLQGYDGDPPIIGATPIFNSPDCKRGLEVAAYLQLSPFAGYLTQYVCIDDDSDFMPHQNLVQCDNEYGLTEADAELAINLLKR